MTGQNFFIFHVDSPPASAAFYSQLLDRPPIEASPTFVLFTLSTGAMLGLWSRHTVIPAANGAIGGTELAFAVDDPGMVDRVHATWSERGLTIMQPPTDMDFGRSFVAADPDGHRLRIFAPMSA